MKKSLIITLLISTLALSACTTPPSGTNNESDIFSTEPDSKVTDTVSPEIEDSEAHTPESSPEDETQDTGYMDLECREPEGYDYQLFANSGNVRVLSLQLPDDWSFEKASDGVLAIKRDGNVIGKMLYCSEGNSTSWVTVDSSSATVNDVTMQTNVEKNTGNGSYRYRICFTYNDEGEEKTVTLVTSYDEISQATLSKLKLSLRFKKVGFEPEIGLIDIEKSVSNSVLIVGNSFINSSKVGYILEEMIRKSGKRTYVEHISRGYAHVDTYAEDEYLIERIRSGDFGAVFVCGYYSNDQAEHLATIKDACDVSGASLFMFPAHNEQESSITYVQKQVDGVHLINWKSEIQSFISSGGNQWDFCINDAHLHSTPLAGYIGAHMIYRAIFGELPSCQVSDYVTQAQVDAKLPGYAKSGMTYVTKGAPLNIFD